MTRKIHLDIGGMSCINCQNKIAKTLRSKNGVLKAKVDYVKGTADVEYNDEKTTEKKIKEAIEKLEYKVLSSKEKSSNEIVKSVGLLLIIVGLFYLLQISGLLNMMVPDRLAETGMGYGMLFVVGLITSVHCVAMCGGIGLSQSLTQKGTQTFLRPLAYNLGRVCSYTLIGIVLGTVGSVIGGSAGVGAAPLLQGMIKIVAGVLMVIMGINMLGIFPWLRRFTIHPPVAVARFIGEKSACASGPFIVGLLNGLMPCGPLQAMWIVALAAGNPLTGALSMLVFSLGTVPLMMGLGSFVSYLGRRFTDKVMKAGAVIVAVMGLAMLVQGLNLSGFAPNMKKGSSAVESSSYGEDKLVYTKDAENADGGAIEGVQVIDGVQYVNSKLELGSYPNITVQAGMPVKWTIDAPQSNINGCNSVMMIQDYDIVHQFETGENVIEFTPDKTGTIQYSCWMGMIYGSIDVVDSTENDILISVKNITKKSRIKI